MAYHPIEQNERKSSLKAIEACRDDRKRPCKMTESDEDSKRYIFLDFKLDRK